MPTYCEVKDCFSKTANKRTTASYGFLEDKKVRTCKAHAKPGMVDLRSAKCIECQAEKVEKPVQASYGPEGGKALRCIKHSFETDVDLKSQKCIESGCCRQATWGESKKMWCYDHKSKISTSFTSSYCIEKGCGKNASYGLKGKKRIYCLEHSHGKEGIINLVPYAICIVDGCNKEAYFGTEKLGRLVCLEHSKEFPDYTQMKNKHICIENGCSLFASYGPEKGNQLYCEKHNKFGYKNVVKKCCIDCDKRAMYGDPVTKEILYCATHAKPGMKDLINKMCISCNKYTAWLGNKNYCAECYKLAFPENQTSKFIAFKQITIINDLEKRVSEKIDNFKFDLKDKQIKKGKNSKRPDCIKMLPTHNVIVEIDEHQHFYSDYKNEEEEMKRLESIQKDCDMKKLVIIRLNPDNYRDLEMNKYSGMFVPRYKIQSEKTNKLHEMEYKRRMDKLEECFMTSLYTVPEKDIEIIKLFFTENIDNINIDEVVEDYEEKPTLVFFDEDDEVVYFD